MTPLTAAQRSARARARRRESGTAELRMQITPGLRQMLDDLQQWHGIEEQAEALQLLILNAHAAGPVCSAPLLAVPRHEYTPSQRVTRMLPDPQQQDDPMENFTHHRKFTGEGDFGAWWEASKWLQSHGYTVGDPWSDAKTGTGKAAIKHTAGQRLLLPAWPQLTAQQQADIDGMLIGNPRTGPLTVYLNRDPEQRPEPSERPPEEQAVYLPPEQEPWKVDCHDIHNHADRAQVPVGNGMTELRCPKCNAAGYYSLQENTE